MLLLPGINSIFEITYVPVIYKDNGNKKYRRVAELILMRQVNANGSTTGLLFRVTGYM